MLGFKPGRLQIGGAVGALGPSEPKELTRKTVERKKTGEGKSSHVKKQNQRGTGEEGEQTARERARVPEREAASVGATGRQMEKVAFC